MCPIADSDVCAPTSSLSTPGRGELAEPETEPLRCRPSPAPPVVETEPDPVPVSPEQRVVDTISGYVRR